MGDTVKMDVTEDWTAIPGLILTQVYAFQNIVNQSMFLRQQPTTPLSVETGHELTPFKTAILTKEASDIFVRMKAGEGVAYFNELVVGGT